MRLEGIHHITAITADAPGNVDFYAAARPAAREEVRQPGRPDRLPPLLRRRGRPRRLRPDLLRVSGRAPRPAGAAWSTASSGGSRPPRRSTSGRSGSRAKASSASATAIASASTIPRASSSSCGRARPRTSRSSPSTPRSRRELALQGFQGVRAYAADPERSRAFLEAASPSSSLETAASRCAASARGSFYAYDKTSESGSPVPAPSITSPGHRRPRSTRPGGSA